MFSERLVYNLFAMSLYNEVLACGSQPRPSDALHVLSQYRSMSLTESSASSTIALVSNN